MKTVQQDVLEIDVYDEKGNLITNLNYTREVKLRVVTNVTAEHILFIEDGVQNTKMLELLGEKVEQNLSDFEKNSFTTPEVNVIKFNANPKTTKLKVVGTGIDYNLDTAQIGHDIKIIFPNVELIKDNEFIFGAGEVYPPVYKLLVLPYNDAGDLYEVQMKERK